MLLGRIAAFYGFSIPEAENETSLGDFVRVRLQGKPKLGDHISFTDKRLVIQDMDGERITKVGLELEFVAQAKRGPHEIVRVPALLPVGVIPRTPGASLMDTVRAVSRTVPALIGHLPAAVAGATIRPLPPRRRAVTMWRVQRRVTT